MSKIKYLNRGIIFFADLILSFLASGIIILILKIYGGLYPNISTSILSGLILISSIIPIVIFRTYANLIRYSTLREIWRLMMMCISKEIILCSSIVMISTIPIDYLFIYGGIDFCLTFVFLLISRIIVINLYRIILLHLPGNDNKKNLLIFDITPASVQLAQGHLNLYIKKYHVNGFLTLNPANSNLRISGFKVYLAQNEFSFRKLIGDHSIDAILFPNIKTAKVNEKLITYCSQSNINVLVAPEVEEIRDGIITQNIRSIKIEDLLGRNEIKCNFEEIDKLLSDKVILITGAAGSIGSEICRQVATFHIKKLVCYDMAETPLHNLRLELQKRFPSLDFVPVVGDVRNQKRVSEIFNLYRPNIVYHAAAYKHVPLMEENPCEAICDNVMGTRNVADISLKYDVEKFVMVSTDKAVNPTNVMGCSKRLAEIYVQSLDLAIKNGEVKGTTRFITTRFGNVLGSNGSVIPLFKEQIASGGPLTVTHPDIIRYFMTIPEACQLVLEASTMGQGGEIFIFDMGEPVKIADMAKKMIELAGFIPGKDIEIVYTGLRPGEKLYEELLNQEESTSQTKHKKIRIAKVREYNYKEVSEHLQYLFDTALKVDIPNLIKAMKQFVPEFKSQNSVYEKYDRNSKYKKRDK